MSTEILQPFQLSPSGGVAVTTVPALQVQQHLQCLASTNPGERVMQPTYGVPLEQYLFAQDDSVVTTMVSNDMQQAVAKWEPGVNVQDVRTVVNGTTQGIVQINVDYSPGPLAPSSSGKVSTATVLVGGSVISNGS